MKLLSLAAFLASVSTGAAVFPAQLELVVSLTVVAGIVAIMVQDYAARRPLVVRIAHRARPSRTFFRAPELEFDPCCLAPWTL
jgi:hypothetical protein